MHEVQIFVILHLHACIFLEFDRVLYAKDAQNSPTDCRKNFIP